MSEYLLRGSLSAALCDHCTEVLGGVTVRLYEPLAGARRSPTDAPTDEPRVLDADEVRAKAARLIAESVTSAEGSVVLRLPHQYRGQALEVDLALSSVPHRPGPRPRRQVQVALSALAPQWRSLGGCHIAHWEQCVPQRLWGQVRAAFDAWVICGHVTVAGSRAPAAGVVVTALDADWGQDEPLGRAITDDAGRFRIDYLSTAFRRGAWLDVDLVGGAEVCFRLEAPSGEVHLLPQQPGGRRRTNRHCGPCLCASLTVAADALLEEPRPPWSLALAGLGPPASSPGAKPRRGAPMIRRAAGDRAPTAMRSRATGS